MYLKQQWEFTLILQNLIMKVFVKLFLSDLFVSFIFMLENYKKKKNNREKSKTRARVEHVFAQIAHWDGDILRTIGKKRADSYHHMLVWCYNIKRLMFLGLPLPF